MEICRQRLDFELIKMETSMRVFHERFNTPIHHEGVDVWVLCADTLAVNPALDVARGGGTVFQEPGVCLEQGLRESAVQPFLYWSGSKFASLL